MSRTEEVRITLHRVISHRIKSVVNLALLVANRVNKEGRAIISDFLWTLLFWQTALSRSDLVGLTGQKSFKSVLFRIAMSAPYEHYEPELIFERYQFARARRSGLPSNAVLDVIDPSPPGCADEREAHKAAQEMGEDIRGCAEFMIGRRLPRAAPEAVGVTPFLSNFMRKYISSLVTAGLFSVQPLAGSSKRIKARRGLFGVEKAGKKSAAGRPLARVVFDARGANTYFVPLPFVLVIFTLFMLLDAMYLATVTPIRWT